MQTFETLGLSEFLVKALNESGIVNPTAIQEKSIPSLIQEDPDFIGLAQTGTGKTAAFGLPLIELIDYSNRVTQGLILAPTRELAQQIGDALRSFTKYKKKFQIQVVYGGTAIVPQMKELKNNVPHILVATPGRLIDLIGRKAIKINEISHIILDEADEMLNMGFQDDIDEILSFTPDDKRTWLFSATMPPAIRRIIKKYMSDPMEVTISKKEMVNVNIEHRYVMVKGRDKSLALRRLIDLYPEFYGLVFCRTKRDTQDLADEMVKAGYAAEALHGDLSQSQRNKVMKRFKLGTLRIVVATDVAARGIDVDDLTHVIHHALPDDDAFYTHRSGRTARAGKKGMSIAIVAPSHQRKINSLQKQLGIRFDKMEVPSNNKIREKKVLSWANNVLNSEIKELPDHVVKKAKDWFKDMTKEDLLNRLLSIELEKLGDTGDYDINAIEDKRGREDRFDKGNRRDKFNRKDRKGQFDRDVPSEKRKSFKKSKEGSQRFFINLGSKDKLSKDDLVKILCDKGKLNKSKIGNVDMSSTFSFFEVESMSSGKLSRDMTGLEVKGRKIRVNRDSDGPKKREKRKKR